MVVVVVKGGKSTLQETGTVPNQWHFRKNVSRQHYPHIPEQTPLQDARHNKPIQCLAADISQEIVYRQCIRWRGLVLPVEGLTLLFCLQLVASIVFISFGVVAAFCCAIVDGVFAARHIVSSSPPCITKTFVVIASKINVCLQNICIYKYMYFLKHF